MKATPWRYSACRALVLAWVLLPSGVSAEQRKDAAEAVQEGSVPNWLEYYQRERNRPVTESKPESSTGTGQVKPASPTQEALTPDSRASPKR